MREFLRFVERDAERLHGIPLWGMFTGLNAVEIYHGVIDSSRFGLDDWMVIGAIGQDVARKRHIKVDWNRSNRWVVL